ncbi:heavy metal-responsive transcriptional regulator [Acidihalobacter ferrooxydans]|uniref:Heavy metal-responsive transcriptional regulator n=1 Tax=Acidihalobacter ferrooxydans TaxID=1765967 RepID=A0A1P8UFU3_9GAMM|nr:heavy metal-responsive transcriptional regulator [Acidihalobacter ferrooxydans]APZ42690.1 heavy metal-responsive transcriptional regulator [Acidihalobacter ferrooxydans]
MDKLLTIGALARTERLAPETLRYYERVGLIEPTRRTASNYRLYGPEAKRRLRFIRRAQTPGFSLAEIGELLSLHARPEADMGAVKALTEEKISDIDQKIADLQRMRAGLDALAGQCPGHGSTAECPILGALLREDQ